MREEIKQLLEIGSVESWNVYPVCGSVSSNLELQYIDIYFMMM